MRNKIKGEIMNHKFLVAVCLLVVVIAVGYTIGYASADIIYRENGIVKTAGNATDYTVYTKFSVDIGGEKLLRVGQPIPANDNAIGTILTGAVMNNDYIAGASRFTERNFNDANNATAVLTAMNDIGCIMTLGIGSSTFTGTPTSEKTYNGNDTAFVTSCNGDMYHIGYTYETEFIWKIGENNTIMNLSNDTLTLNDIVARNLYATDNILAFGNIYALSVGDSGSYIAELFATQISSATINVSTIYADLVSATTVAATNMTMDSITHMTGSYSNGEAYVCVTNTGAIYAKDSACS